MPKAPIPINLKSLKPWGVTYCLLAVLVLVVEVVGRMDFLVGEDGGEGGRESRTVVRDNESKSASLYGLFGNIYRRGEEVRSSAGCGDGGGHHHRAYGTVCLEAERLTA